MKILSQRQGKRPGTQDGSTQSSTRQTAISSSVLSLTPPPWAHVHGIMHTNCSVGRSQWSFIRVLVVSVIIDCSCSLPTYNSSQFGALKSKIFKYVNYKLYYNWLFWRTCNASNFNFITAFNTPNTALVIPEDQIPSTTEDVKNYCLGT